MAIFLFDPKPKFQFEMLLLSWLKVSENDDCYLKMRRKIQDFGLIYLKANYEEKPICPFMGPNKNCEKMCISNFILAIVL